MGTFVRGDTAKVQKNPTLKLAPIVKNAEVTKD